MGGLHGQVPPLLGLLQDSLPLLLKIVVPPHLNLALFSESLEPFPVHPVLLLEGLLLDLDVVDFGVQGPHGLHPPLQQLLQRNLQLTVHFLSPRANGLNPSLVLLPGPSYGFLERLGPFGPEVVDVILGLAGLLLRFHHSLGLRQEHRPVRVQVLDGDVVVGRDLGEHLLCIVEHPLCVVELLLVVLTLLPVGVVSLKSLALLFPNLFSELLDVLLGVDCEALRVVRGIGLPQGIPRHPSLLHLLRQGLHLKGELTLQRLNLLLHPSLLAFKNVSGPFLFQIHAAALAALVLELVDLLLLSGKKLALHLELLFYLPVHLPLLVLPRLMKYLG